MAKRLKSKAKKNTRTTKSGTQTNAPTRRTSGNKLPQQVNVPESMIEAVCGVTDPFCSHAFSAKVFDLAHVRTISAPSLTRATFVSDTVGATSVLLVPNWNNDFMLQGTIVSGGALYSNGSGRGALYPTAYRIVSMGAIITAPEAPLNRAGTVCLRVFNAVKGTTFDAINLSTYNCDAYRDIPLSELGKGFPIVFQKTDVLANTFVAPDTTWVAGALMSTWVSNGWPIIQIGVLGATPSVPVLSVQAFVHYEFVYADNQSLQQLATYSPPAHPAVVNAVSLIQSKVESFAHTTVESLSRGVRSAARQALLEAVRSTPRLTLGA